MSLRALSALPLAMALSLPAWADSFTSSAASLASQSVASLSESVSGSSTSSSGNDKKVAAGTYRVTEMAAAPGKTGKLQLQLVPVGEGGHPFALTLDAPLAQQQGLAVGSLLDVQARPFGVAFALAASPQPFLLALADDWMRDLDARVVR
ncbi:hypothetical protein [Inhella crocodyli]|uniref:Uncharacterized protein n=1 Tax=Inhella crocodyli TaxID=2499851 RepID=A0A3S2WTW8_9BURK|nr:hypothetical protein [Inhella crocodyli]RVT87785.1 hypothetical protein EOD73_01815 [Inhella crocodyli]